MAHEKLHEVLAVARRRLRTRDLVRGASAGLVGGLVLALAVVVAHRLIRPDWPLAPVLGALALAGPILGSLTRLFRRKTDDFTAAIALEQHHRMKERLSSALFVERSAPADCPAELVELVLTDGELHAGKVDVRTAVPIGVPRSARAAAGLAVIVGLAWWLMPPIDLLGRDVERETIAKEADRLEEKDRRLRERVAEMQKIAEKHEISSETKRLLADLKKPRSLPKTTNAKDAIRRPLADLEELKKRAETLAARESMQGLEQLIRSMQGIDERMETGDGARARKAMSEGSPERASEAMQRIAEKLAKNAASMSSSELAALSRDLQKLAASLGGKFPELSKDLAEALSSLQSGDSKGAAEKLGKNAADLARLARLMKEKNLLGSLAQEIEFTQDELAQLPKEWKSGPPPKICPDCLKGT